MIKPINALKFNKLCHTFSFGRKFHFRNWYCTKVEHLKAPSVFHPIENIYEKGLKYKFIKKNIFFNFFPTETYVNVLYFDAILRRVCIFGKFRRKVWETSACGTGQSQEIKTSEIYFIYCKIALFCSPKNERSNSMYLYVASNKFFDVNFLRTINEFRFYKMAKHFVVYNLKNVVYQSCINNK